MKEENHFDNYKLSSVIELLNKYPFLSFESFIKTSLSCSWIPLYLQNSKPKDSLSTSEQMCTNGKEIFNIRQIDATSLLHNLLSFIEITYMSTRKYLKFLFRPSRAFIFFEGNWNCLQNCMKEYLSHRMKMFSQFYPVNLPILKI